MWACSEMLLASNERTHSLYMIILGIKSDFVQLSSRGHDLLDNKRTDVRHTQTLMYIRSIVAQAKN